MRRHRLYLNQALADQASLDLENHTQHYLKSVLRVRDNQEVIVFNGDGNQYSANVQLTNKTAALQNIRWLDKQIATPYKIHLLQAIARGDHMDYAIQKATELGVTAITPLLTARTQGHDMKKWQQRWEHWQKVCISACEQSGRAYLPTLNAIAHYEEAINTLTADSKLLCQPHPTPLTSLQQAQSILICVGPEGGLTDEEINKALANNFQALALGDYVLRTETAATSAITLVNYLASINA